MKDFRSLEQVYRELRESRGTEIRRKIANVGRPENNVKDETSKLAKQAEIKKIIDEAKRKVKEDDQSDDPIARINAVADNLKQITNEPKSAPKLPNVDDHNIDLLKTGMKKPVKEAKEDDKKKSFPPKKDDSDKDDKKSDTVGKSDNKDSKTDDMDAKEIKGGKTQVDLNPKTDDDPDDTSTETKKSKTAAKAANKEIGAKGVKEEIMHRKNLGLPESLIQAVTEVLKGGQKKLDKNHNGKLDGDDFKKLRKEDKSCACEGKGPCQCETKEEVEQIVELSKDTLQKYVRKASTDAANHAYTAGMGDKGEINKDASHKKATSRLQGVSKAAQKLAKEEVEQIVELSTGTRSAYRAKAGEQAKSLRKQMGVIAQVKTDDADVKSTVDSVKKDTKRKLNNRVTGILRSTQKEEIEQVDEISGNTMLSYSKKSSSDAKKAKDEYNSDSREASAVGTKIDPSAHPDYMRLQRRNKGLAMVKKKMGLKEVELSAEELARINEIEKNFDEGIIGGVASLTKNAVKVPVKAAVRVGKGAIHAVGAVAGGVKNTVDDIKKAGSDVKKAFKK